MTHKLRDADEAECVKGGYASGAIALEDSIAKSDFYLNVYLDSQPLAWFGVKGRSVLSPVGFVWMLSAPAIEQHKVFAARESIRFVRRFMQSYPILVAYVDVDHVLSIRWLQWLGFAIDYEEDGFFWMVANKEGWKWGS